MQIANLDTLTPQQLENELAQGGRFIHFEYCISLLLMTWRSPTDIYFIRVTESRLPFSLPWTLLTLLLGWWGLPWGLLSTPGVLLTNLSGGHDVTPEVVAFLQDRLAASGEFASGE